MSKSNSANMICPKCGVFQPKADTCDGCGVIVAKILGQQKAGLGLTETKANTKNQPLMGGSEIISDEAATIAQIAAVIGGIAFSIFIYFVTTPIDMSIDEFVAAKKESFHMRGFRIEGTVEPDSKSWIVAQSSDGVTLSSLKLSENNTIGYVTYDQRSIQPDINAGDIVQVTGRFESVPYFDGRPGNFRKMTMAVASSIDVIKTLP